MANDKAKKQEEPKKLLLSEVIRSIDASRISAPVKKIVSTTKSKRGPSEAGRISGLKGLNLNMGQLGQQFKKQ